MKKNRAAAFLLTLLTALSLTACIPADENGRISLPERPAVHDKSDSGDDSTEEQKALTAPENSASAEYFLAELDQPVREAYRALYEGIYNYKNDIELPEDCVKQSDFGGLLYLVNSTGLCGDSISPDYKMYVDSNGYVERAAVEYIRTPEEGAMQYATLTAEAQKLTDQAAKLSDDYSRVKFFHDELVRSCEYSSESIDSHCAYGALCAKKAVCEGYAKAFMLLCEMSDIPCLPACGMAVDKDGVQQLHMWNKVQLDGEWYNVDCTWDDPLGVEPGSVRYDYFLVSDKDISGTHNEDRDEFMRLPAAKDESGSWFDREDRILRRSDKITKIFREQCALCIDGEVPDSTVRFKCEDKGVYAQVMAELFDADSEGSKGMVTLLQEFLADGRGLSYVLTTDENMRTINLKIVVQMTADAEIVYG